MATGHCSLAWPPLLILLFSYFTFSKKTSTIPTDTCTPGHVHGSLSVPPYWWLWGWDQWVGGWQGDLLWPQVTVAWRGPPFLFYFFLISPFQRRKLYLNDKKLRHGRKQQQFKNLLKRIKYRTIRLDHQSS